MNKGESDKLRVLVVEDEPIAREILADLLRMAGYDVLSAHSGEQALLTLVQERGRLDCLFTAVDLPGLVDGWMVADEFRVHNASMPIVFATAGKPALRPDRAAFVARPVLPPKAVVAVNRVTGRAAAAAKARQAPRIIAETAPPPAAELPLVSTSDGLLKATG